MTYAQESAQRRTLSSAQHAHDNAVPDFTDPSAEWWEERGEQVMADIGAALDGVPGLAESDASKIYDAVDKMLFAHREDIAKAIGDNDAN